MKDVMVWVEQRDNRLMDVSLEMLQKATELAAVLKENVSAVLIGNECKDLADELILYGASKVFLIEDSRLQLYQSGPYVRITADIISEVSPEIVLIGGTSIGMDIASRVAATLRTGLTSHCVDLYIEKIEGKDQLVHIVPGWKGNMMLKIICPEHRPQMATVRPGVMEKGEPDHSLRGEIVSINPDIRDGDFKAKTLEMVHEEVEGISLDDADIIVSGGYGLYSAGGFKLIEELADAINGEVAGTRPAFDQGWIPENRMIGQSGKMVRPRLFVSIGASGAMHYTTGFSKANVIVGIDRNPKAAIFNVSDLGVVGDLEKIVPCLIEELKK
ncbi:MAG: electron transfer flavoprotein subunit alpha/FixB family protein [Thermodesulfobacteriota bacterium]|nr:electron transfer flavoprotein subunit alpha/FixB family protein [Thermodesulfobacteriota bacterium]